MLLRSADKLFFAWYFLSIITCVGAKYHDQYLYVQVSVSLSVCLHILNIVCLNFTNFTVHVNYGRDLVFVW